ncbi:MAG TPA: DUF4345 domain-containing protein [Actinomycetota bacterium]|jgi:hypothetical protein|nr:DUF4345 domain-containing protein [Actinomycetota bacterium]
MTFPVVLLHIVAVLFAGFGVGFAAVPEQLSELLFDAAPGSSSATIDMRATYGGVAVGLAAFVWLCSERRDWVRPGLLVTTLVLAALALTRLIGIVADGSPNGFVIAFLVLEIAGALLTHRTYSTTTVSLSMTGGSNA